MSVQTERPTVVSFFAGCGGLDLGFKQAGFEIIWANDFNEWACHTYASNFGPHIVHGSIEDVDMEALPECDVMTGGFPCPDFSMIWKRGGIETERGNLYTYFVKAVMVKQPKIFVAENVKGLLSANEGKAMERITQDFAAAGYKIHAKLYNFAQFGVPQLRERVLIIGVREDLEYEFVEPTPTHGPGAPEPYVTAGEALLGVEDVPLNNEHQKILPRTAELLSLIPEGMNFSAVPKDHPRYVKGMISHVYRRLHRDKPSTTIIAGGGGGTWGYHFEHNRPLTNRERARLFGYPDTFKFEGSITEVRRQIGNSVPPTAAKVIAEELLHAFVPSDQGVSRARG